jgi:hypothetical protein
VYLSTTTRAAIGFPTWHAAHGGCSVTFVVPESSGVRHR